jgi:hypothetical protein
MRKLAPAQFAQEGVRRGVRRCALDQRIAHGRETLPRSDLAEVQVWRQA